MTTQPSSSRTSGNASLPIPGGATDAFGLIYTAAEKRNDPTPVFNFCFGDSTCGGSILAEAVCFTNAQEDFACLSHNDKLLLLAALQSFAQELLRNDSTAAEHAGRLVEAVTGSSLLGAATVRAVRAWASAVAGPAAEDQLLLDRFLALPIEERRRRLRLLLLWEQAPWPRRAMTAKLLDKDVNNKFVAWLCGISGRTLRRCRPYHDFARMLCQAGHVLPRGRKGHDGRFEAWDEE
jgi:hypothetical protein